jgi:hypothetical protein
MRWVHAVACIFALRFALLSYLSKRFVHNDMRVQLQPLGLAACYMREFLAKSHPLVRRSGPVCPYVL